MNYKLIAIKIGSVFTSSSTGKEIDRIGNGVFGFERDSFPMESITSSRAKLIYEWIMTLAKVSMDNESRDKLLIKFCKELATTDETEKEVVKILSENGLSYNLVNKDEIQTFYNRDFHPEVVKHCREFFIQGNYFHAVFEATKAYNYAIKDKSKSQRDGSSLMMDVLDAKNGVLKITKCSTESEVNTQNGIKFLSSGLMQAIRNPTAHEPKITWPVNKQDCLDILSFVSYLFRQLDKAVYVNMTPEI
ncbi:TIGR02391 family protein [Paenibacillus xylanilyticus]|uniref:TIGR02391 family protein n=1 Tax=Paenibacillus xylanilyticus TaxID=248903 RepID=A0A7Y6EVS7_9BACL|nr:TIGR02391 family protein [Paenibacillus xylanilyticus]NUU75760.1 TIGR02391 family protein [Paenibacillus xylanilyticus]